MLASRTVVGGIEVHMRRPGGAEVDGGGEGDSRRLARAAQVLGWIRHPGVVEVVDPDGVALATRWVGPDVRRWPAGSLGIREVAGLGAAAATTLADLHALGWNHGQVWPEHLLIGPGGRPVWCGVGGCSRSSSPGRQDVQDLAALLEGLLDGSAASHADARIDKDVRKVLERAARGKLDAAGMARHLADPRLAARLPATPMALEGPSQGPLVIDGDRTVSSEGPDSTVDTTVGVFTSPVSRAAGAAATGASAGDEVDHRDAVRPEMQAYEGPGGDDAGLVPLRPDSRRGHWDRRGGGDGSGGADGAAGRVRRAARAVSPPQRRPLHRRRLATLVAGFVALLGLAVALEGHVPWRGDHRQVVELSLGPAHQQAPSGGVTSAATCPAADRGCGPVPTPGGVLTVGGDRFALATPGDEVVLGRWTCSPTPLPAVLDTSNGGVWVWDRWAAPGEDVTARSVATVAGATHLSVTPLAGGCDGLEVVRRYGAPLRIDPQGPR